MAHKYLWNFLAFWLICFKLVAQNVDPNFGVIPAPFSIKQNPGTFLVHKNSIVNTELQDNPSVRFLRDYLQQFASNQNFKADTGKSVIDLTAVGADSLQDEGYELSITPNHIKITGKNAGLFYGVQTLIQLLGNAGADTSFALPCLLIRDHPRFKYRGMMLDVSRHFFPPAFVKEYIDLLAAYKINTFHWHLTDDQGWRIEIKKYPKLTEVGSQRAQTLVGNIHQSRQLQFDNTPYGGFYTQDEIRDIVKYAAGRYINIVPEIEMPGHSLAALAAYPELSCNPKKSYSVAQSWGVFDDVYCPSEYTFQFLEDVLTEVIDLFPGKYIHIGGDEVPKNIWRHSAFCQHLIKKLHLKNEHGLQSYFVQRIEKFLNEHGKSVIGWDEILQGGLAPNATVMSWRSENGGIAAARKNHDVIMTSQSAGLYFDKAQGKSDQEPLSIGGFAPLEKTYAYNPVPDVLTPQQQNYIIGVQANLWTEYIATAAKAEYMLLPRLLALSEVAWSAPEKKNFKDFAETRLPKQLLRLDQLGINFRVPQPFGIKDTFIIASGFSLKLRPSVSHSKIFYTTDGYLPTENSTIFKDSVGIEVEKNQTKLVQTVEVTPAGKKSNVAKILIYNREPFASLEVQPANSGLKYLVMKGDFSASAQLDSAHVIDSGVTKNINVNVFKRNNPEFGTIYQGYIRIDEDGNYLFGSRSDDGSQIFLDDELVVDNDGKHALFRKSSTVPMCKGYHKIKIKYFESGAFSSLKVYMNLAGKPQTELPPDILFN